MCCKVCVLECLWTSGADTGFQKVFGGGGGGGGGGESPGNC